MDNNTHKKILNSILHYLSSASSLAMQIDGLWGTGKTFYIKHTAFNKIKHYSYIPIYISLNGIHSILELQKRLNIAIISDSIDDPHKKITLVALNLLSNNLENIFNSNKYLKILRGAGLKPKKIGKYISNTLMNNKKIVLIFDDLERSAIPLNIIFGFLSNITTKFQCKSLIISNQSECNKKDKQFLQNQKEKFISKTIHFGNNSLDVAHRILAINIPKNYHLRKWILQISKQLLNDIKNDINLRTLQSIIDNYKILYNDSKKDNVNNLGANIWIKSLKVGYISIFILTDAIKKNKINDPKYIKNIFKLTPTELPNFLKNTSLSRNKYLYKTFFKNSNRQITNNIIFTKDIYQLIKSDLFSYNSFENKIKTNFYSNMAIINNEFNWLSYGVYYFSDYMREKHENKFFKALNTTHWSKINLSKWINIYTLLSRLNKSNLLNTKNIIDLNTIQQYIINKAKNISIQNINILSPNAIYYTEPNLKKQLNKIYNKKSKEKVPYYNKKHIMQILNYGDTFKHNKNFNKWFLHTSIFNTILKDKNIKKYLINKENPRPLVNLKTYLHKEISCNNHSRIEHSIESNYIYKFISFIKKTTSKTTSPILLLDLKNLQKELQKCKTKLTKATN